MPDTDSASSYPLILDSNALMMPFQFSIDLEAEIERLLGPVEILVPSSVVAELKRLSVGDMKARAALSLASRYRTIEVRRSGDDAIMESARERGAAVLTNDRKLRARLREAGIPVIYLRERSRLAGEGLPLR